MPRQRPAAARPGWRCHRRSAPWPPPQTAPRPAECSPSKGTTIRSDLLVIGDPAEAQAEAARTWLLGVQKEYLITPGDAVVAVKQPDRQVKLNQLFSPVAAGVASGALWGSLLGLIVLMPLAGAAIGAASGALRGKLTDVGINDDFMRDVSKALDAGHAALFLLIRKMTADKVMAELQGSGGCIICSSFDETKEEALRDAPAGVQAAVATAA